MSVVTVNAPVVLEAELACIDGTTYAIGRKCRVVGIGSALVSNVETKVVALEFMSDHGVDDDWIATASVETAEVEAFITAAGGDIEVPV